jgi:hypothetical protein
MGEAGVASLLEREWLEFFDRLSPSVTFNINSPKRYDTLEYKSKGIFDFDRKVRLLPSSSSLQMNQAESSRPSNTAL